MAVWLDACVGGSKDNLWHNYYNVTMFRLASFRPFLVSSCCPAALWQFFCPSSSSSSSHLLLAVFGTFPCGLQREIRFSYGPHSHTRTLAHRAEQGPHGPWDTGQDTPRKLLGSFIMITCARVRGGHRHRHRHFGCHGQQQQQQKQQPSKPGSGSPEPQIPIPVPIHSPRPCSIANSNTEMPAPRTTRPQWAVTCNIARRQIQTQTRKQKLKQEPKEQPFHGEKRELSFNRNIQN